MLNSKNYYEMNELANEYKRECNLNELNPIEIFSTMQEKIKNLTIVFLLMDENISGAAYKKSNQNIIFINSTHSLGRQRFTLAHEIYHLKYDKTRFNLCGVKSNDEIEKKADNFASCFLMSHGALIAYKKENNIETWNLNNILKTEQYFQISHQAFLWRIRNLEEITYKEYSNFKQKPIQTLACSNGYDLKLYQPYSNKKNHTIGNYIKLTNKAFDNDIISPSKKYELLLDAFCGEINNLNPM